MTTRFTANVGNIYAVTSAASYRAADIYSRRVARIARTLAPVGATRGLKGGIEQEVVVGGSAGYKGRVISTQKYSAAVELGSGIHGRTGAPIRPKNGKFLVFRARGGGLIFAKSVQGQKAQPFLRPAIQAAKR